MGMVDGDIVDGGDVMVMVMVLIQLLDRYLSGGFFYAVNTSKSGGI